jgi:hypothetical protein
MGKLILAIIYLPLSIIAGIVMTIVTIFMEISDKRGKR